MLNAPKPESTYCSAPWTHLCSVPGNNSFQPCCGWSPEPNQETVPFDHQDPLNHPWMQQLRQRMLNNEYIDGCNLCYMHEKDRDTSLRRNFDRMYGRVDEVRLRYVEINFGNLCNLKCRMCNSWASSKWITDEIKLGKQHTPLLRRHVADSHIDLAELDRIRVTGGEPLMDQDQILSMLDTVVQHQGGLHNLTVDLINNGSFDMDPRLAELLKSTKLTLLATSVDGMGAVNEYQRTGSRWSELATRLRHYDSCVISGKWHHQIALSLGALNVNQLMVFCDWIATELPHTSVALQPIYHPLWQSVNNLPDAYKRQLIAELEDWEPKSSQWGKMVSNTVCNLLRAPRNKDIEFMRNEIKKLDHLRDEDFAIIDPRTYSVIFEN